jgi:hypothetical protein
VPGQGLPRDQRDTTQKALDGNKLKFLDQFEMPPVVAQHREIVAQRSGAKQKIEVANRLARGPQPATFAPKNSRDLIIDPN